MSGTSLDGISSAVVRFDRAPGGRVTYDLLGMSVRPYDAAQRDRLAQSLVGATPRDYCRLAFDLGEWLADAAITAIAEAGVDSAVDEVEEYREEAHVAVEPDDDDAWDGEV